MVPRNSVSGTQHSSNQVPGQSLVIISSFQILEAFHQGMMFKFCIALFLVLTVFLIVSSTNQEEFVSNQFIVRNKGTFLLNPDYISYVKVINLDPIQTILLAIQNIKSTYDKYCQQYIYSTISSQQSNFILLNESFKDFQRADSICKNLYLGKMQEIRDRHDLAKFLVISGKNSGNFLRILKVSGNYTFIDPIMIQFKTSHL